MKIETNGKGFVKFENRNFSFKGDAGTWAKIDKNSITVKRAGNGIISSAYETEMKNLCERFGIDFGDIKCGNSVTVEI